jgi:predicted restriction endonuclease
VSRDWAAARAKVDEERACRHASPECAGQLDAAHIIPRSRIPGPEAMMASNIVPLCRTHHERFDAGGLDILPYLTRDEQAFAVFLVGIAEAYRRLTGERP